MGNLLHLELSLGSLEDLVYRFLQVLHLGLLVEFRRCLSKIRIESDVTICVYRIPFISNSSVAECSPVDLCIEYIVHSIDLGKDQ